MDNIEKNNNINNIGDIRQFEKENDWFLALAENPSFSFDNFSNVGLTPDNTGIKDKEFYRNSEYIQDKFSDENGVFDDDAFNATYNAALSSYQMFATDSYEKANEENIATYWDPDNFLKPLDGIDKETTFAMIQDFNPDRLSEGIIGIGRVGAATQSKEWIARQQEIFNPETGMYEGQTVDDRSLSRSPLSYIDDLFNPLVLATWEEDGEHLDEYTGRMVKHLKGEPKFNNQGTYYYERLAGRDPMNKEFKTAFDNIIALDSPLKKYDFFDSTDLDKSITGSLFKTAFKIAPFAMGGPVKSAYAGVMLGLEMANTLGTLYRMSFGDGSSVIPNSMIGVVRGLKDERVSLASQESQLTFENFIKIAEGVVFQWAEQRELFKHLNKALGTERAQAKAIESVNRELASKPNLIMNAGPEAIQAAQSQKIGAMMGDIMKRNNRISRNISVMYMSSMQGLTMFEEAVAQGVDERDAAIVALGGTLGIYGVIRKMKLGELFLPEVMKGEVSYAQVLREPAKFFSKEMAKVGSIKGASKAARGAGIVSKFRNLVGGFWSDVANHTTTIGQKMVGEGLEELTEQVAMDMSRGLYNLSVDMGFSKNENKLAIQDGMFERYGMAFAGGAIGAGMFYGLDFKQLQQQLSQQDKQTLIHAISQEGAPKVINKIRELTNKNTWGNDKLSASKVERDDNGNYYYLPATSREDTQNYVIGDRLEKYVKHIDNILNQEGGKLTEDQVLDKFVMYQQRVSALEQLHKSGDGNFTEAAKNGTLGLVLQDYLENNVALVEARTKIDDLKNSYTDSKKSENTKTGVDPNYEAELKLLTKEYEDVVAKRDNFFSDENMAYHTNLMMFAMDQNIASRFFAPNFKTYVEIVKKKPIDQISKGELEGLQKQYDVYNDTAKKHDVKIAYGLFQDITNRLSKSMDIGAKKLEAYSKLKTELFSKVVDVDAINERLVDSLGQDEFGQSNIEGVFKQGDRRLWNLVKPEYRSVEGAYKILEMVKSLGYVDQSVKNLILSLVPSEVINKPSSMLYTDLKSKYRVADHETGLLQEIDEKFLDQYDKVRTFDDIAEIRKENKKYLTTEDAKSIILNLAKNDLLFKTKDYAYVYSNKSKDEITKLYNQILSEYEALNDDMYNAVVNKAKADNEHYYNIEGQLQNLDNNPVQSILESISLNETGTKLTILDLIKEETNRFKETKSLDDYDFGERDLEVEVADAMFDALEATILAANTEDLSVNQPFGHNRIFNELVGDPSLHKPELSRNVAATMLHEIATLRTRLNFFKYLSEINRSNLFGRHLKLGLNMNKFIYNAIKGNDGFEFIKDINYNGKGLLDGIESLEVESLDYLLSEDAELSENENTLNVNKDMSLVQDKIYNNFQEILEANPNDSLDTIISKMFGDVISKLDSESHGLYAQETSTLDSKAEGLSNYDLLSTLFSMIAIKKSDFDYLMNDIISDTSYAPLFAQEHIVRLLVASAINPDLMNNIPTLISGLNEEGSNAVNLLNTLIVDGAAGVGKTKVIADLAIRMLAKLKPDLTVAAVAPTEAQVENLSKDLPLEKVSKITAEGLVRKIIGDEAFAKLDTDLKSKAKESDLYQVVTENTVDSKGNRRSSTYFKIKEPNVVVQDNVNFEGDLIILDENTHINTLYSYIISKYASETGKTILSLGNNIQMGYNNSDLKLNNIESAITYAIRSPKLYINMRVGNTHKIDNDNKLTHLLNYYNINDIFSREIRKGKSVSDVVKLINNEYFHELNNAINNDLIFTYFENDQVPLTGDKLVVDLIKQDVESLLGKVDEIGYIYSDENSATYKIMKSINSDKIKMFKDTEVQGREFDYAIIDTDFSSLSSNRSEPMSVYNFLKKVYTMTSRAKIGSIMIDRGVSNILSDNFVKAEREPVNTPSGDVVIKKFKDNKLKQLAISLDGYDFDPTQVKTIVQKAQQKITESDNKAEIEKAKNKKEEVKPDDSPVEEVTEVTEETEEIKPKPETTKKPDEVVETEEEKNRKKKEARKKKDEEDLIKLEEEERQKLIEEERKKHELERKRIEEAEKKKAELEKAERLKREEEEARKRKITNEVVETELGNDFINAITTNKESDVENEVTQIANSNPERATAYGFYNRVGSHKTKEGYKHTTDSNNAIYDLNTLFKKDQVLTEAQAKKTMDILNAYRDNFLRVGRELTDVDVTNLVNMAEGLPNQSSIRLFFNDLKYLNNGDFLIEARHNDVKTDIPFDTFLNRKIDNNDVDLNLIYRINPKNKYTPAKVITLGKLQAPKGESLYMSSYFNPDVKYTNWYNDIVNQVKSAKDPNFKLYATLNTVEPSRITGLLKSNEYVGRDIKIKVEDLRTDPRFKYAMFSEDIYAYAGMHNRTQAHEAVKLSEKINGRGVIVTTVHTDGEFEFDYVAKGESVEMVKPTPQNLRKLYEVRQKYRRDAYNNEYDTVFSETGDENAAHQAAYAKMSTEYPPVFRLMVLDPEGMWLDDYLNIDYDYIQDTFENESDRKKFMGTYGSSAASVKMLTGVFNLRANYSIFNDVLSTYKRMNGIKGLMDLDQARKFNKMLDSRTNDSPDYEGTYAMTSIRMFSNESNQNPSLASKEGGFNTEIGLGYINLNESDQKQIALGNHDTVKSNKVGIYTSERMAKNSLTILNDMIELFSDYLNIPFNAEKTTQFISAKAENAPGEPNRRFGDMIGRLDALSSKYKTSKREIEVNGKKITVNPGDIVYNEGGEVKVYSGFNFDGAWRFSFLLNKLNKLSIKGNKYNNYELKVINQDGKTTSLIDLNGFFDKITDQNRIDLGGNYFRSFMMNTLRMAIHGAHSEKSNLRYSMAPMPRGIFETIIYRYNEKDLGNDLVSIYNKDSRFTTDAVPRSKTMRVEVDYNTNPFTNIVGAPKQHYEGQFNKIISKMNLGFKHLLKPDGEIANKLDRYYNEAISSLNDIDNNLTLDEVVNKYKSQIEKEVNSAIKNLDLELKNKDVITSAKYDPETGKLEIIRTLASDINDAGYTIQSERPEYKTLEGQFGMKSIEAPLNIEWIGEGKQAFKMVDENGVIIKGEFDKATTKYKVEVNRSALGDEGGVESKSFLNLKGEEYSAYNEFMNDVSESLDYIDFYLSTYGINDNFENIYIRTLSEIVTNNGKLSKDTADSFMNMVNNNSIKDIIININSLSSDVAFALSGIDFNNSSLHEVIIKNIRDIISPIAC